MKKTTRYPHFLATASLAAVALALAPLGHAQSTPKEAKGVETKTVEQHQADMNAGRSKGAVSIASEDAKSLNEHTAKKLAGRKVRGSDDKDLGSVKDFFVDPHASTVECAVISSGGVAGVGDKLRLVPFQALQESTSHKNTFTLNVDKAAFEQLPVMRDDELKSGRLTLTDTQRRQLESIGSAGPSTAVAIPSPTAGVNAYLVLASDIAGRELHSGSADIGKIEAIVIDTSAHTATALFDPKSGFTNQKQKFLVPLGELQISDQKHEAITTALTVSEFEQAGNSGSVSATTQSNASATVAASTTAAPPPVGAPAAAGTANASKDQASASTAQPKSRTQLDDRGGVKNELALKEDGASPSKVIVGSTEESQDIASATNREKSGSTSSATGETKELSATGRTSTASDHASVAANDTSANAESKAATTDKNDANAKKDMARADDQSKAATSTQDNSSATKESTNASVAANDTSANSKSKATTTDMTNADASKAVAQASDQSKAPTSTHDDQAPAKESTGASVAASDTTSPAAAAATANPSDKKSDVGSSDQSSSKAAGNIAANADQARSANTGASPDSQLTPTGKQSSDQTPAGDPELVTIVQNIRKALDEDDKLARANVQITPEDGVLVLRGTVNDPTVKNAIEKKAHDKAGGKKIDNQIQLISTK